MLRQKVRRGSEDLSEGIRRIRRGLPEEEPSATAVCIDEGRGRFAAPGFSCRVVPRLDAALGLEEVEQLGRDRPHERPIFQRLYVSRRRQRLRHHCQQLGDLLRVAGGVGSDATAEGVDYPIIRPSSRPSAYSGTERTDPAPE